MSPSVPDIMARAAHTVFGRPLVHQNFMSVVVEAIVATVICPEWTWRQTSGDPGFFTHPGGATLEVKWATMLTCRGTIRSSPVAWAQHDPHWRSQVLRNEDIFVLAHHPDFNVLTADHRDASQWRFRVVEAKRLPASRSIEMADVEALTTDERIDSLAAAVAWARASRDRLNSTPVAAAGDEGAPGGEPLGAFAVS